VRVGDLLETIDGVEVKTTDFEELAHLLLGPEGSTVRLGLRRDGKLVRETDKVTLAEVLDVFADKCTNSERNSLALRKMHVNQSLGLENLKSCESTVCCSYPNM